MVGGEILDNVKKFGIFILALISVIGAWLSLISRTLYLYPAPNGTNSCANLIFFS